MTEKIDPLHEKFIAEFVSRNEDLGQACTDLQSAVKSISEIINEKDNVEAFLKIGDAAAHTAAALESLRLAAEHHKTGINLQIKQQ